MTTVLIATASRHGSTCEIADEIARVLASHGLEVVDEPADEIRGIARFDAVIVGSAVYAGRWMREALDFVTQHADELATKPLWLFSSGPIGQPPQPEGNPRDAAELVERTGARGHRVFPGKLDSDRLGLGEKVIVGMLRAPRGDYRDFPAVAAWADEIARALVPSRIGR